jgi:hypothetical protein
MFICNPALVYLIMSIISIFGYIYMDYASIENYPASYIVMMSIFSLLWTWLLNYLCSSGYETVSWILVLIPIVLMVLVILVAIFALSKVIKDNKR